MPANDFLDSSEKTRLLDSLRKMTQSGKVVWKDASLEAADPWDDGYKRNDVFTASIEGGFRFLLSSIDRDGVAPYKLDIYKRDAAGPVATIEMTPMDEGGDEYINEHVNVLYTEVYRRIRRPDEAIRKLFEVIDQIDPEPPF